MRALFIFREKNTLLYERRAFKMFKKLLKKSKKVKTEDVVKDLDKFNLDLIANNQKLIDELRRMQK